MTDFLAWDQHMGAGFHASKRVPVDTGIVVVADYDQVTELFEADWTGMQVVHIEPGCYRLDVRVHVNDGWTPDPSSCGYLRVGPSGKLVIGDPIDAFERCPYVLGYPWEVFLESIESGDPMTDGALIDWASWVVPVRTLGDGVFEVSVQAMPVTQGEFDRWTTARWLRLSERRELLHRQLESVTRAERNARRAAGF